MPTPHSHQGSSYSGESDPNAHRTPRRSGFVGYYKVSTTSCSRFQIPMWPSAGLWCQTHAPIEVLHIHEQILHHQGRNLDAYHFMITVSWGPSLRHTSGWHHACRLNRLMNSNLGNCIDGQNQVRCPWPIHPTAPSAQQPL